MADYLTTDTELASIADAIRTKGGTSAQLTYPAGFVSAIEAIPTGGGGTSHTVTINLSNPNGSGYAATPCCILYESDDLFNDERTQIGQIASPTGSTTVTVGKPILTAMFFSNTSYLNVSSASAFPQIGNATPFDRYLSAIDSVQFFVSGDDSVSIMSVDYNDD